MAKCATCGKCRCECECPAYTVAEIERVGDELVAQFDRVAARMVAAIWAARPVIQPTKVEVKNR
jgi:hypothetical protein